MAHPHGEGGDSPTRRYTPLFESPSKFGVHHTISAYTPTEQRFRWQNTTNSTGTELY